MNKKNIHTLKLYKGAEDDQPMSQITIRNGDDFIKAGNAYITVSEDTELFKIRNVNSFKL